MVFAKGQCTASTTLLYPSPASREQIVEHSLLEQSDKGKPQMPNPHDPLPPADKKPGEVMPEIPETELPDRELPEGQLPGMPVSHDPLLNPNPIPSERQKSPLD